MYMCDAGGGAKLVFVIVFLVVTEHDWAAQVGHDERRHPTVVDDLLKSAHGLDPAVPRAGVPPRRPFLRRDVAVLSHSCDIRL
jgi:hypothetical protein